MATVFRRVRLPSHPRDVWLLADDECSSTSAWGHRATQCDDAGLWGEWDVVLFNGEIVSVTKHDGDKTTEILLSNITEGILSGRKGLVGSSAPADSGDGGGGALGSTPGRVAASDESASTPGSTVVETSQSASVGTSGSTEPSPKRVFSAGDATPGGSCFTRRIPLVEEIDGQNRWLVPGWIDVQVNDLSWMSEWQSRTFTRDEHAETIRSILSHVLQYGVTGVCIATVASPISPLIDFLTAMKTVMDQQEPCDQRCPDDVSTAHQPSARLHGAVVEGTFMNPECHGCHNPTFIEPPSMATLTQLLDTGAVKSVNIAPEMGDKEETLSMIRHSVASGALVAAGHCKPHAAMMREAVAAGCSYIIHLGNGPTGSSLKAARDGGMMEECLRSDDILATVICDNRHIHPGLVRDWTVRKQLARMVAVSDIAFVRGPPSGSGFEVFGRRGKVSDDGKCLVQADWQSGGPAVSRSSDSIAGLFGSNVTMYDIFVNLVNLFTSALEGVMYRRHPALNLAQAVSIATAMCSTNPAKLLAGGDSGGLGLIKAGCPADVLLLRVDEHSRTSMTNQPAEDKRSPTVNYDVTVERVWCTTGVRK